VTGACDHVSASVRHSFAAARRWNAAMEIPY
jgi:hypothetical protein